MVTQDEDGKIKFTHVDVKGSGFIIDRLVCSLTFVDGLQVEFQSFKGSL